MKCIPSMPGSSRQTTYIFLTPSTKERTDRAERIDISRSFGPMGIITSIGALIFSYRTTGPTNIQRDTLERSGPQARTQERRRTDVRGQLGPEGRTTPALVWKKRGAWRATSRDRRREVRRGPSLPSAFVAALNA